MRVSSFGSCALIAAVLLAGLPGRVHAQAFGSRTLGGGISSPTTSTTGAFGSNTTGSAFNTGSSLTNNNGMSGANGANGASNGLSNGMSNNGAGMSGMLGQAGQVGQNSYARQRQGQFVGADRADAANPLSQATAMNSQMNTAVLNQLQQRMRQEQQQLNRLNQQQQQGQNGKVQLRIPMRLPVAERAPIAVSTHTTSQLARRLTKLPALTAQGPIVVLSEGQTVVLRGQVATEMDRELAAEIVQLEPGVSGVRNELIVGRVGSTAVALPQTPSNVRQSREF